MEHPLEYLRLVAQLEAVDLPLTPAAADSEVGVATGLEALTELLQVGGRGARGRFLLEFTRVSTVFSRHFRMLTASLPLWW